MNEKKKENRSKIELFNKKKKRKNTSLTPLLLQRRSLVSFRLGRGR